MSIRRQLLFWLLPPLIFFVVFISSILYNKWSQEILSSFQSHLRSVVIAAAQPIRAESIAWLAEHHDDPKLIENVFFQETYNTLSQIQKHLPTSHIYVFLLEPMRATQPPTLSRKGERDAVPNSWERIVLLDTQTDVHRNRGYSLVGKYGKALLGEEKILDTRQPLVTSPYLDATKNRTQMTAFAPIFDGAGEVVGILGADANLGFMEKEQKRALVIIVLGVGVTLLLMIVSVTLVANKISDPVRKLNAAALAIAAGEYGEKIAAKGPKEVLELANTLNTLSECLEETLSRLQESSFTRERMYGEYECSLLLQHYMLNKVIENIPSNRLHCEMIKSSTGIPSRNLSIEIVNTDEDNYQMCIAEAQQPGFSSLYELLHHRGEKKKFPHIFLSFLEQFTSFHFFHHATHSFLFWSAKNRSIHWLATPASSLDEGDLLFYVNTPFCEQFPNQESIEKWFGKILRHFAAEGLNLVTTMLRNELHFLTKKSPMSEDLIILCFQKK